MNGDSYRFKHSQQIDRPHATA